jgi:hypothetical protein
MLLPFIISAPPIAAVTDTKLVDPLRIALIPPAAPVIAAPELVVLAPLFPTSIVRVSPGVTDILLT